MNKIIETQLNNVQEADLSNFDPVTKTYFIPQRKKIQISEDNTYLLKLNPSAFSNQTVSINWNQGSVPKFEYMKADVSKKMGKMIRVVAIQYDPITRKDLGNFWSGWLSSDDIEILQKI